MSFYNMITQSKPYVLAVGFLGVLLVGTLGGFLFTQMGRVPSTTEFYVWNNLRFEIVDMDGKRIDKVLVTPADEMPSNSAGTTTRFSGEPHFAATGRSED